MERTTEQDVSVTILRKDGEYYIFMYDDRHKRDLLYRLTQWAGNPDLSFTFLDAARLSQKVRE